MDTIVFLALGLVVGAVIGLLIGKFVLGRTSDSGELRGENAQLRERIADKDLLIASLEKKLGLDDSVRQQENQILQMLTPVKDSLDTMRARLERMENERTEQFGIATEAFRTVKSDTELLRAATEQLNRALTGTNKRGHWGEIQLERFVEAAGLSRYLDFTTQRTLKGEDDSKRPDMVINLPDGKHIIIDAKVPISEYLAACDRRDRGEKKADLFAGHAAAVKFHIDELAKREYWNKVNSSADYVLLFMPSDAFLHEALMAKTDLFDYALSKNVALVSPVSLFTTLKSVAYTWKAYEQTEDVTKVLKLGTLMYERIGVVVGHINEMGKALGGAVKNFNNLVGSVESRLLVSARQFPGFDPSKLTAVSEITEGPSQVVAGELDHVDLPELTAESTMDNHGDETS